MLGGSELDDDDVWLFVYSTQSWVKLDTSGNNNIGRDPAVLTSSRFHFSQGERMSINSDLPDYFPVAFISDNSDAAPYFMVRYLI